MLLVTTAIEEYWGKDEEILFLGEWCKLYTRRAIWESRVSKTMPDPWSDRKRRFAAYQYTENIYQEAIGLLAHHLNKTHSVDHPVRYWKILCGPWLRLFINAVYHKWEIIYDVMKHHKSIKTLVVKNEIERHIPLDMLDFETIMVADEWNFYIGSLVAVRLGIPTELVEPKVCAAKNPAMIVFNRPNVLKRVVSRCLGLAMRIINRPSSVVISQPYLSKMRTVMLGARLRSVPTIALNPVYRSVECDQSLRAGLISTKQRCSEFESFLNEILIQQIPHAYLEGFSALNNSIKEMNWPMSPSAVLTATNHWSNDFFKCNMANKSLQGSKLKIICHGGGGKMKYSDFQAFELDVCDNYFTWGWSAYSSKCTKGFFIKEALDKRRGNINQRSLLHITLTQYRYSKFISSTPSYEQFIGKYIDDQIKFLNSLAIHVKRETLTKLHYDYQNSIADRILAEVPKHSFALMGEDYLSLLRNAKLVVTTYNCTTLVESIAYNIPTVVFWDHEHWELLESAVPYIERLRECGVFHSSPESAASMVNKIWNNIDEWWQSEEVVAACNDFRSWFCRDSRDPIKDLVAFCNL